MTLQSKRLFNLLAGAAFLLLIPFIAMQFTEEVKWGPFDFLVAGVLLFSTALALEWVLQKVTRREYRIALCLVILAVLFLVWAELAVGIFGTPLAGS